MAVINDEFIEENIEQVIIFIENYPHRNANHLYYIGSQTNNPLIMESINNQGVTQEMLKDYIEKGK